MPEQFDRYTRLFGERPDATSVTRGNAECLEKIINVLHGPLSLKAAIGDSNLDVTSVTTIVRRLWVSPRPYWHQLEVGG